MKKETIIGILLAIMAVWVIGFSAPKLYEIYKDSHMTETIKTDTVMKSDTIYFEIQKTDSVPQVIYETITKRDTLYLHDKDSDIMVPRLIFVKKKDYSDTLQMGQDTLSYTASVTGRSYEDEEYPKLDSISFILRASKVKEVQTVTKEVIKWKKKRGFKVAPYVGYGYNPVDKKMTPSIGVALVYLF